MSYETERLKECATEVSHITEQIEELESQVKALKARRRELTDKTMLSLMLDTGMDKIVHSYTPKNDDPQILVRPKRIEFKVASFMSGNLPKDPLARQAAIEHLSEIGKTDIIKSIVNAEFPKKKYAFANRVADKLREKGAKVTCDYGVHFMTLRSQILKLVEEGELVNLPLLGLYQGQTVKFRKLRK